MKKNPNNSNKYKRDKGEDIHNDLFTKLNKRIKYFQNKKQFRKCLYQKHFTVSKGLAQMSQSLLVTQSEQEYICIQLRAKCIKTMPPKKDVTIVTIVAKCFSKSMFLLFHSGISSYR